MSPARYLLILLPLLGACASTETGPRTIADLQRRAPTPEQEPPKITRAQAAEQYHRFLATAPGHEREAHALKRLADLELERREGDAPPPESPAYTDRPPEADAAAAAKAEGSHAEVIALYLERLERYPDHPNNDRVLYQLARAYQAQGEREQALSTIERLARDYPSSALVAEARFRLGEAYFVDRDYARAEAAYRSVLARGADGRFYEPALHKHGWSLFKLSRYDEAVEQFMRLLAHKGVDRAEALEPLPRADRERAEDALRAISLSFGYLQGPRSLVEYLQGHGDSALEPLLFRRLGEQYLSKARYSDAAASFATYVQRNPGSDAAPDFQLAVIEAYREGGFPSQVIHAQEEFVTLFDLETAFWAQRDPAAYPQVVELLQSSLRDLARHYHAQYQDYGETPDLAAASRWYQRYLERFPSAAGAQEMHLYYGELLTEADRPDEALTQYEQAAYRYAHNGRAAEAGHAAVLAYEAQAERLRGEAKQAWLVRSREAMRRFAEAFPRHPQAAPALARATEQAYAAGAADEAIHSAERFLEAFPGAPQALHLSALSVLGQASYDSGEYLRAEDAFRRALTLDREQPGLRDGLAAAIYAQGEREREAGTAEAAVTQFLRVREAVPESDLVATAEHDAAALLLELEQYDRAAEVLERLRRDFPDHPLQPQVTEKLAVAYSEARQPDKAAPEFQRLAERGDGEVAREALWQAAQAYAEAGDLAAATASLQRFIERYPRPLAPAVEARQHLVEIHERLGEPELAARYRKAIVAADRDGGGERTARTRRLAAEAMLALGRSELARYRTIALIEPLQKNLARKKAAMQAALRWLEQAAESRFDGITTAATYELGELYADFARAMLDSERPAGLEGEALAEYELLLEEEAIPFEEKAIGLHEANIRRAPQGVYDRWVKQSYSSLARLMPARYAKSERSPAYAQLSR